MVRHRMVLAVFGAALVAIFGCGGADEQTAEERLEEKSAYDVLDEADQAEYTPPEDGELSEEQVEMYLEVQERSIEITRAAARKIEESGRKIDEKKGGFGAMMEAVRGAGSVVDALAADLRAAQELGHNPAEYRWVQERVRNAFAHIKSEELRAEAAEQQETFRSSLEEALEEMDPEQRSQMEEMMGDLREDAETPEVEDEAELEPAEDHNIELVREHVDRISELIQQRVRALDDRDPEPTPAG